MPTKKPRRIRLAEAVAQLKPFMSQATFYGDKKAGRPGPRWTMVEELKIRSGPKGVTLDRRRFERWLKTLEGELAHAPHPNSERLGHLRASEGPETSYGGELAYLCRALEKDAISKEQFDRAVASLETDSGPE